MNVMRLSVVTVLLGIASSFAAMPADLHTLADRGDADGLKRALGSAANSDIKDASGRTPLLLAVRKNHLNAAKVLFDAGADPNVQDRQLDSPFLYAGAAGYVEIVRLLAPRANTSVTNRYGGIALIPASERGHVETVRFLLEHTDTKVNHVNGLGWTALLEAIILSDGGPRHQQVVELLIRHGADVNLADKDGVMPLEHASARRYTAIAAMLRKAGAKER